jgi:hypothetical protein
VPRARRSPPMYRTSDISVFNRISDDIATGDYTSAMVNLTGQADDSVRILIDKRRAFVKLAVYRCCIG